MFFERNTVSVVFFEPLLVSAVIVVDVPHRVGTTIGPRVIFERFAILRRCFLRMTSENLLLFIAQRFLRGNKVNVVLRQRHISKGHEGNEGESKLFHNRCV